MILLLIDPRIPAVDFPVLTGVVNEVHRIVELFTVGTGNGTTKTFTFSLPQRLGKIIRAGAMISYGFCNNGNEVRGYDDGAGVISGTGVAGTINYLSGALSLTFTDAPDSGTFVSVGYQYED